MSENTIIDPEQNIYNANSGAVPPPIPPQEDPIITTPAPYAEKEEKEGMSKGAKIAAGVGLGIAAGAGIAVLSSADTPQNM